MIFIDILHETVMITSFVMVIMLLIELLNIQSNGKWSEKISQSNIKQIFLAISIALVPGCLGPYALVSLYTHHLIGFGSLVAGSIVSCGDEAFVMLSLFPVKAVLLFGLLVVIGFIFGFTINLLFPNKKKKKEVVHFEIHQHENEKISFSIKRVISNLAQVSFTRSLLLFGLSLFIIGIAAGWFEHGHSEHSHDHADDFYHGLSAEYYINLSFIVVALFTLWAIASVSDHFIEVHLWGHVIKKHFIKIFGWTFIALAGIEFLTTYVDFENWAGGNPYSMLLLSVAIGILPISGPHLLIVNLFSSGSIPLSILIANSIVQDGHGGLPLLAESKLSFLKLRLVTISIAALVGWAGISLGF